MDRKERLDDIAHRLVNCPAEKQTQMVADLTRYVEIINRAKYVKKKTLAAEFGISQKSVDRRLKKMTAYIGNGKRYSKYVLLRPRRTVLILEDAFRDYIANEEALEKGVPCMAWEAPFDRKYMMLSADDINRRFAISARTAYGLMEEMRTFTGAGMRYPQDVLITSGRILRVKEDAFIDFMKYRNLLYEKVGVPAWSGKLK